MHPFISIHPDLLSQTHTLHTGKHICLAAKYFITENIMNHFVDAAVDKAASAAKLKVKSMLGGGGNAKQPNKSGGVGGLFPSAGESGNKEKKGGLFGGLLSAPQNEANPGGAAASGDVGGAGLPGGAVGGAGGAAAYDSAYQLPA
ncbi:hypothetical protein C0J45_1438 [Silurus meridionalis]|nr:hypothetical protein C0J45_1438 [Silurus meridionalis]